MALRFYNTLGRKVEDFTPLQAGEVKMYTCGPTVYNYAHIGNLRSFVFADLIKRVLTYNHFTVHQALNITDVDDKTIRGSQKAKEKLADYTRKYEGVFWDDLAELNISKPEFVTRASGYIDEMVQLVETLLTKGFAYRAEDGIYFAINKFAAYGQLADIKNVVAENLRTRIDEYAKDNPQDFALWKFWRQEDGDVFWENSLGKGRPGWHLECSAMSMACFGPTIDIHTGGSDLIFPHHENEIAQSEAATGQPFVNYWLHSGHILIDGQKMAKSLGNIITLKNLSEKNITPLAYRYFLLTAHYRSTVNFTEESIDGATTAYHKLLDTLTALFNQTGGEIDRVHHDSVYAEKFLSAVNDDLGTPTALALIWQLLKDETVPDEVKLSTILHFDEVLGLSLEKACHLTTIPEDVRTLAEAREEARLAHNWPKSDQIRAQIEALGYDISDTPTGPKLTKMH